MVPIGPPFSQVSGESDWFVAFGLGNEVPMKHPFLSSVNPQDAVGDWAVRICVALACEPHGRAAYSQQILIGVIPRYYLEKKPD